METLGKLRVFPKDILRLIVSEKFLSSKDLVSCLLISKSFMNYLWPTPAAVESLRRRSFVVNHFKKKCAPKLARLAKKSKASRFNYNHYYICDKCLMLKQKMDRQHRNRCTGRKKQGGETRSFANVLIYVEGVPMRHEESQVHCKNRDCKFSTFRWCGEEMSKHKEECVEREVFCTGCKWRTKIKDIATKHSKCFGRTEITCKYCNFLSLRYFQWDDEKFNSHVKACGETFHNRQRLVMENYIDVGSCPHCHKKFI